MVMGAGQRAVMVRGGSTSHGRTSPGARLGCICVAVWALTLPACTPTVKVQAPEEPIVINLNIKIEQEVRIKVEEDAKQALASRPDLF